MKTVRLLVEEKERLFALLSSPMFAPYLRPVPSKANFVLCEVQRPAQPHDRPLRLFSHDTTRSTTRHDTTRTTDFAERGLERGGGGAGAEEAGHSHPLLREPGRRPPELHPHLVLAAVAHRPRHPRPRPASPAARAQGRYPPLTPCVSCVVCRAVE
jgi:hypothetical protein